MFVVCAGLIGGSGSEDCRASVASTELGSELCSTRQVAAPFVAGTTITGLSVFAVRRPTRTPLMLLEFERNAIEAPKRFGEKTHRRVFSPFVAVNAFVCRSRLPRAQSSYHIRSL